jgi:acyl-CoA thioesterase
MPLTPSQIVLEKMLANDPFSQWLGIEVETLEAGYCELRMKVRPEMCNGFGIAHGGIAFSLADSALAFAANSMGQHALSLDTSIQFMAPIKVDTTIRATTEQLSQTKRTAFYAIRIEYEQQLVAYFKGTVFLKESSWE